MAASRRRLNIIEIALLLFFLNMALYSVRYITLFAIISVPIAAKVADQFLNESDGSIIGWIKRKDADYAEIDALARGYLWPVLTFLAIMLYLPASSVEFRFDEKIKPMAAIEFLKREQIPGNMFDNDEFGDCTIFAAWPQYHVFIDGRLDMYGSKRLKEYRTIVNFEPGWELIMKKYDMNWVFFDANTPFSRYLLGRSDWHLIYADKVANIFVRTIPLYDSLIRKYPNVKPVPADDAT